MKPTLNSMFLAALWIFAPLVNAQASVPFEVLPNGTVLHFRAVLESPRNAYGSYYADRLNLHDVQFAKNDKISCFISLVGKSELSRGPYQTVVANIALTVDYNLGACDHDDGNVCYHSHYRIHGGDTQYQETSIPPATFSIIGKPPAPKVDPGAIVLVQSNSEAYQDSTEAELAAQDASARNKNWMNNIESTVHCYGHNFTLEDLKNLIQSVGGTIDLPPHA